MEKRRIGSLEVSIVGLGCNNFGRRIGESEAIDVVDAALGANIDLFDTADVYGRGVSEQSLGKALKGRRSQAFIATKFGSRLDETRGGANPEYVRRAAEASLRRLGTDYIDLYQLHLPDPAVPIADTLGALGELVRAGKVREIGCSNFSADQLREAEAAGAAEGVRLASVQNQYSMLQREAERDVLPECERAGIVFLPYFPLASGLLTGKYRRSQSLPRGTRISDGFAHRVYTDENLAMVESLVAFATTRGHTLLELAIGWLLSSPTVASVIAGATSPTQVRTNAASCGWLLNKRERAEVAEVLAARPRPSWGDQPAAPPA